MKGTPQLKQSLKEVSPTILTCMGGAGVVVTVVTAVRATPKAVELIKRDSLIKHDGDANAYTPVEAVQSSWQCYIPTMLLGASTIACIFGANALNKHYQASLTSAYAMLNESYKHYRKAAKTVYGEDADAKISVEAAKEQWISDDGRGMYYPDKDNSETVLFYEECSKRYFTSTMAAVINAQYHFNRNLTLRGDAYLNELYTFLGLELTDDGDTFGWSMDDLMCGGILWLDFENKLVTMDDGLECYIVSTICAPIDLDVEDL